MRKLSSLSAVLTCICFFIAVTGIHAGGPPPAPAVESKTVKRGLYSQ